MKFLSAFFLIFLVTMASAARKDPAEYWNRRMKGEAMPKAIEELVHGDPAPLSQKWKSSSSESINMGQFNTDFDTKPVRIIYHVTHAPHHKVLQPFLRDLKLMGHGETEPEGKK
ncbi:uncharacterized protein LOC127788473 isoform X3 [Diospyros lotus]|uniref:uncharacterized protein LOC127788473 isoform X3 n=1 Tax=Diospyros lotus TaxID=55363 RepID=UPI00225A8616|nr:uncharacterized protein LOC127788473 isoform X3 [Diospyros lotus]